MIRTSITSYIGRDAELEACRDLLREGRLVTITGPGGIGKSRLAEQVLLRQVGDWNDGSAYVRLADLSDPDLVTMAVASAVGLHDAETDAAENTLLHFLRSRHYLLVLDNCEHVVGEVAQLALSLLSACPGLRVLATSRCALDVMGEQLLPVPALATPGPDDAELDATPSGLSRFDAVRLLTERASAVHPGFAITADNAHDVLRLSRQLDGHPLAIELAAGRLRSLDAGQIADRIDSDLAVLATDRRGMPERHRSLHAALEGSYDSCTPTEQAVWAAVAVFAATFDLVGAERVCEAVGVAPEAVLDAIDALVANSVLIREPDMDGARFRLLVPLRELGLERLASRGAVEIATRALRDHVAALVAQAEVATFSPDQVTWARRMSVEMPNVRVALEWSIRTPGEAETGLAMACAVSPYVLAAGLPREARLWLDRGLAATAPGGPLTDRALAISALCALFHCDLEGAAERIGDLESRDGGEARGAYLHAKAFLRMLQADKALELAEAAAAAYEDEGRPGDSVHPRCVHGLAAAYRGDLDGSRVILARATAMSRAAGSPQHLAICLFFTAVVEIWFGDPEAGRGAAEEALRLDIAGGQLLEQAYEVEVLAWFASRSGDHARAAALFGIAEAKWERCGSTAKVAAALGHELFEAQTREALGPARFASAVARGRALEGDEMWRFVFASPDHEAARPDALAPLTTREAEIALLVAQGMTNPEIADRLVIARRTADTHVGNILTKLDLANRAQITRWVTERSVVGGTA